MKGAAIATLVGLVAGAQAQTVFYSGDFNGVNGHASQMGGTVFEDMRIYDDFVLSQTTTITGVFANFLQFNQQGANSIYWEIRQGITPGNGGTVVHASTVSPATVTATGNGLSIYTEYKYESAVSSFDLAPGTYFLTVALSGPYDSAYLSETEGANGVGSTIGNNSAFLDAWDVVNNDHFEVWTPKSTDYSMGLVGTAAVPEPASILAIGLGIGALARRKRQTT
ncbi:MAG TPA: PEP-CTERM sorting domain-containing protein [Fimbriimonas sp.]|nr:PEP-CTERM sorting domain-containing protein [Fimbriimonas sp.]